MDGALVPLSQGNSTLHTLVSYSAKWTPELGLSYGAPQGGGYHGGSLPVIMAAHFRWTRCGRRTIACLSALPLEGRQGPVLAWPLLAPVQSPREARMVVGFVLSRC